MFSDFLNGSKALSPCIEGVIEAQCEFQGGTFVEGGTCTINGDCAVPTATPTPTPTATPSATPTNTPIPNGGSCADPLDCASGNCVDDVCCDTPCNGPSQACNQPGREGICSPIAAGAPTASPGGLVLILVLLISVGATALVRRRARAH